MLAAADSDAAVPGRRGRAGGRAAGEGRELAWLVLEAVTPTGPLPPEETEAPGS